MPLPPAKMYMADLDLALRVPEKSGIKMPSVVPALLHPAMATSKFLENLAWSQENTCTPCKNKGIICQATNLNHICCYACIWGRNCNRQNKKEQTTLNCEPYEKARQEGLTVIPEGAVWGGRDDQPPAIGLNMDRSVDDPDPNLRIKGTFDP
ncbi:hypothetical protein C8T65DRAFT_746803 [Cerioporus squamosus]|nr:hypothetical protein C8T65DRAFT_746803 [Cerioporus squamosus]